MSKWNVAAYLRLSSDDGDKAESNSIGNQRSIVKQYISKNRELNNIDYYIDDGYSGTTFDRPDFQKMINVFEYAYLTMFYLNTSAITTPMGVQNFFHLFLEKGLTDI